MVTEKPAPPAPRKRGRPVKAATDASADIRKAALTAFARAGFSGASIFEISKMAGVAKPLVHYHYASKDALWEASVGEAVANLHSQILVFHEAINSSVSVEDVLLTMSKQLVLFASRNHDLVRIVLRETGQAGTRSDWLYANFLQPSYAASQLMIAKLGGESMSGATALRPEHVVPAVLGVMHFPFLEAEIIRTAYGVDVYSNAYLERHAQVLFQVFLSFLKAR